MFIFERQVSRRILEHQRHLLPHESGIPLRILLLNHTPSQLRRIVLGMVKRGDFDAAVRELIDMMAGIAMETRLTGFKTLAENYYGPEGLPYNTLDDEEESDEDESDDGSVSDNDQEFENRYGTEWLQWTPDWPSNSWLSKRMRWHKRPTELLTGPPIDSQKDISRETAAVASEPETFEPVIIELLDRRQRIFHSSDIAKVGPILEKLQLNRSHTDSTVNSGSFKNSSIHESRQCTPLD
ncbi:hypothetical protein FF38_03755, partial [Lucilia cuprina]